MYYSSWNILDRAPSSVTVRNSSVAQQRPRILGGQFFLSRLYRWYTLYEYLGEISKCEIPIVEFVPFLLVTVFVFVCTICFEDVDKSVLVTEGCSSVTRTTLQGEWSRNGSKRMYWRMPYRFILADAERKYMNCANRWDENQVTPWAMHIPVGARSTSQSWWMTNHKMTQEYS